MEWIMIKRLIVLLAVGCWAPLAQADLWQDLATYELGAESKAPDALDALVAGTPPNQYAPIERKLIELVQSKSATAAGKRYACRMLQRIGTARSVPALAGLLHDKVLSHYARLTLERMTDVPAADSAMRAALSGAPNSVKPGLMASLAERGDAQAVGPISKLLGDADPAVAGTAMRALGRIGGKAALGALRAAEAPAAIKAMHLEAIIDCAADVGGAEGYAALSMVYDTCGSDAHRAAALTEMFNVDASKATPVIIGVIKGAPSAARNGALRLVVTGESDALTQALDGSLGQLKPPARAQVIRLLGKRGDPKVLPTVTKYLGSKDDATCVAAIATVGELGGADCVKLLLGRAAAGGAGEAAAYKALARMDAQGIDAALIKGLADDSLKAQAVKALAARGSRTAPPQMVKLATDPNPEIRSAVWANMAEFVTADQLDPLMKILVASSDRAAAQGAIKTICAAAADKGKCFDVVARYYGKGDEAIKLFVLELGPVFATRPALDLERAALKSSSTAQQDKALRALAAWPNADAMADLLTLARQGDTNVKKIIALRGYIEVAGKGGSDAEKAGRFKAVASLAQRPEEQRLLISKLKDCRHIESFRLAKGYLDTPAVKTEAALTAIEIARRLPTNRDRDEIVATLTTLADSKDRNIANRAKDTLRRFGKGR